MDCDVQGKGILEVTAYYQGKKCGSVKQEVCGSANKMRLSLEELHLWECGNGRLYDIIIEYNGAGFCDRINSYAGMRVVRVAPFSTKAITEMEFILRLVTETFLGISGFQKRWALTAQGFIRKFLSRAFCIIATKRDILYGVSMETGDLTCQILKAFFTLCRNGLKR